jgi:hypothetical protein
MGTSSVTTLPIYKLKKIPLLYDLPLYILGTRYRADQKMVYSYRNFLTCSVGIRTPADICPLHHAYSGKRGVLLR